MKKLEVIGASSLTAVALVSAIGCAQASQSPAQGEGPSHVAEASQKAASAESLSPVGGSSYPSIDSLGVQPIDPLAGADGFEPLVVEEEGGSRIVTPFYSVFVPHEMFPGGFTYDFSPRMSPPGIWGDDLYLGDSLSVRDAGDGDASVTVYVTSTNWLGVQGDSVGISAGPVPGNPAFHVVVSGPADHSSDPTGQAAREALMPSYLLVSPSIVAVQDESGAWKVAEDTGQGDSAVNDSGETVVSTTAYEVRLGGDLWPNGCLWRYYGEEQSLPDGVARDFLAVFEPDSTSVSCVVCAYDGQGADLEAVTGELFSWVEVPGSGVEGHKVFVGSATREDAERYAPAVSVLG